MDVLTQLRALYGTREMTSDEIRERNAELGEQLSRARTAGADTGRIEEQIIATNVGLIYHIASPFLRARSSAPYRDELLPSAATGAAQGLRARLRDQCSIGGWLGKYILTGVLNCVHEHTAPYLTSHQCKTRSYVSKARRELIAQGRSEHVDDPAVLRQVIREHRLHNVKNIPSEETIAAAIAPAPASLESKRDGETWVTRELDWAAPDHAGSVTDRAAEWLEQLRPLPTAKEFEMLVTPLSDTELSMRDA